MPTRSLSTLVSSRLLRFIAVGLASSSPVMADDYDFGRSGFGAWTIPVPLDVQAQQDLQPGQGMLVVGVRPGSTASELGISPGDVLTSLNNTPVSTRQSIREVVSGTQPGDAAQASVLTPAGDAETLTGTFQARPPRPNWAGMNGGPGAPADPNATGAANGGAVPGGLGGFPGGFPGGFDPQAIIAQQRQDLLNEQDAISTTEHLLASLRAELSASGNLLIGAWQLHYQLLPTPPTAAAVEATTSMPGSAPAPSAAMTSDELNTDQAWHCALTIQTAPLAR